MHKRNKYELIREAIKAEKINNNLSVLMASLIEGDWIKIQSV